MIELYSNEPNLLRYEFIVHGVSVMAENVLITVTPHNASDTLDTPIQVFNSSSEMGFVEYVVPTSTIKDFRFAKINISYDLEDYGTITDAFSAEVVKRYIGFTEINVVLGPAKALSWEEFVEVEKNVRYTINSYCGQSFNSWKDSITLSSHRGRIDLPYRLAEPETVTGVYGLNTLSDHLSGYRVVDSGFSLINEDQVKTISMFRGVPKNVQYVVAGTWGYLSVPSEVRAAAIELIKDNLCPDKNYRRKYIDNMRNENFRIQLRDEAFTTDTTGNAFVDDILRPFKRINIGVV